MQNNKDYDIIKLKIQFYSYVAARVLINIITIISLFYSLDIKPAIILTLLNVVLLPFTMKKAYVLNRVLKTLTLAKAFIELFDNKNKGDKK